MKETLTDDERIQIYRLFMISLGVLFILIFLSADILRKNKYLIIPQNFRVFLFGMFGGLVFGFINNFSSWFGMTALRPLFVKKFNVKHERVISGLSSVFGNGISAIISTFIVLLIKNSVYGANSENNAVWVNTVGVVLGSLLGLFVGYKISIKIEK